jgi:2-C-methyl-D-erythritol 4-phosphate cytidylyltransferase
MPKNLIIITAGGNGERMKATVNKIFLPLNGKAVIFYTLKIFERLDLVDEIIITAREQDFTSLKKIIKESAFTKVKKLIPANGSRQESTWRALKWLTQKKIHPSTLVGTHNAVNPLVSKEEIKAVFQAAKKWGAALLAMAARDTVKIVGNDSFVQKTPVRSFVWYAQTPQVAKFTILWQAFKKAAQDNDWGTDDTMLIERLGKKVKVVPCSWQNFKITYPADLVAAQAVLEERQDV